MLSKTEHPKINFTEIGLGLTTPEAARILGLSEQSLRQLRCRGGGPKFRRLGRRSVRYSLADIQAFWEALPTGGGQQPQQREARA